MCDEGRLSVGDLVNLATDGDSGAFEELYSRYHPYVLHGILATGVSYADAWDMAQETFLHAYRGLHTLHPERELRFGGWLRRIAMNVLRKHAAKVGRARETAAGDCFPEIVDVHPTSASDNPRPNEEYRELYDCIDVLAAELRRIIVYRFFFADSGRQAAHDLGMSEATHRVRVREAMDLLRRCLISKGVRVE